MPRESTITRSIVKYLNGLSGCMAIKLHGSRYSTAGWPDVLCIDGRRTFTPATVRLFEVKRPGGKLTKIQRHLMAKLAKTNAPCYLVTSLDEVKKVMEVLA